MNYKVLYRKYRPTTFDEVVGQTNSITLIKDGIINDKISHAYIFSGPRGTGKTSSAKIFAKAINCLNNTDGNPCGECSACKEFATSSDVYEIDAASNNGVDQIREIIDNIKLSPINSKYKVYIIDEVHMLSTSAFNALLLTLEEPPSHVVFILATTDIQDVPITVLSRCQRIDFKKISDKDLNEQLNKIAKLEDIDIDEDAIREVAEYSDGGMRDALSILDQLSKINGKITVDTVLDNIGLVSRNKITQLIDDINNNNVENVESFVNFVRDNAMDYKTIIKKIVKEIKNRAIKSLENSVDRLLYDDYKKLCFELTDSITRTNVNIDSYDLLELILNTYIEHNPQNISQTIKKIEEEVKPAVVEVNPTLVQEKPSVQNNFPGNNMVRARVNNCFIKANKDDLINAKKLWQDFVSDASKQIKGMLLDTDVVLASNEILVIKTEYQDKADEINEEFEIIQKEISEIFNKNYKICSLTIDEWEVEMNKFKENKKNNVKYEYMEEILPKKDNMLVDIFDSSKIEIK